MKDNSKIFSVANKKLLKKETIDAVLNRISSGSLNKKDITIVSPYKEESLCNLRPTVISAIGEFILGDVRIALSQPPKSCDFSICVEVSEDAFGETNSTLLAVVSSDGVKCCRIIENNNVVEYKPYNVEYDGGAFLVLAYMHYILIANNRFSKAYHQEFQEKFNSIATNLKKNEQLKYSANDFAFLSEVVYREFSQENKVRVLDKMDAIPLTKKDLKAGKYKVLKEHLISDKGPKYFCGEIVFSNSSALKSSLADYTSVTLSESEKRMVPSIPEWYVQPAVLSELVDLVCCSTKTTKPKRNFMFRGPSSTGKTSLARALAAKLNKPYVYLTCSADTESYDFLGQPMYDSEGKIKFVESQFISAIKKGWVVEIQEPYIIAKQGVLTALNGLLDDSNGITLSTGEYITRHPDTVVILTTNVDYVGCRQPNQSVLRRMNAIYDIEMPTELEIKNRVKSVTKFNDDNLLDKIIEVFFKVNELLESEDCTDGVCTVSELIDWVSTIIITGSITDSAVSTIISKATYDKDIQLAISNLISAKFDNVEYNV